MIPELSPSIILPGESKSCVAFGDEATFLLTGEQTGGRYTMFQYVVPPGGGPPPHRHDGEDEWFLVTDGSAEFFKDGIWTGVPVGSTVFMPRGAVHAFRNAGDTPLKLMIHTAPAGFEIFFARCADECSREGGPDMARIVGIAEEFGIFFDSPA